MTPKHLERRLVRRLTESIVRRRVHRRFEPDQSGDARFVPSMRDSRRQRAEAMEKRGESSIAGFVVIVVDDDPAVRNSLKFSLETEGLTVRCYATGDELLSADLTSCNCLVVDQKMPGMSGLDLIAKLRERRFSAPAILITSHPSLSLRQRAEKADVPIVEKPLLGNALHDRIRAAVGNTSN
jgi:two-component system, LuxR family, response regulator FixJ